MSEHDEPGVADGLRFRRLEREDIPLVHRWLHRPHVARWWYEDLGTLEEVSARYGAYIDGTDPVEPYVVLLDGRPIGHVQLYRVADDEEYARLVGDAEGLVGVDIFIAEQDLLYRGLGPRVLRRFLAEHAFSDGSVRACLIDPEPENAAAIRAYEKVGFRHAKTVQTSGGPAYFMLLSQKDFLASGER